MNIHFLCAVLARTHALNHLSLKLRTSPYMKVILSRRELDEAHVRSFTCVSHLEIAPHSLIGF